MTLYAALGDSFSAGTGTRAATDDCYRSPYSFPELLSSANDLRLDFLACSGVTARQVIDDQLPLLTDTTELVTVTAGGNDVGYPEVLTDCAMPGWIANCEASIARARGILTGELPVRLDTLYTGIRQRAPHARVVVAGYPRLFNGGDCSLATFFSTGEMAALNAGTDDLNALIRDRAEAQGVTYVDVQDRFTGHATCDDVEFINGLSWPIGESYHPNRLGQQAYAEAVAPLLGLLAPTPAVAVSTEGVRTLRPEHADPMPSTIQRHEARVEFLRSLELDSPENLAQAQACGVPADRVRAAVAQLHSEDLDTAHEAVHALHALHREFERRRDPAQGCGGPPAPPAP